MAGSSDNKVARGGIDLGGTKVEAIVVDPGNHVLGSARRPTPTDGPSGVAAELVLCEGILEIQRDREEHALFDVERLGQLKDRAVRLADFGMNRPAASIAVVMAGP